MHLVIPDELKIAFTQKKLIPIVGAGVSMSLRKANGSPLFPSWSGALELAALELTKQGKAKHAAAVRAMLGLENFHAAADFAKEGLVGSLWKTFLQKSFDVPASAIDPHSLALGREIWKLSNRIITLNFDKGLEFACENYQDLLTIDFSRRSELADFVNASTQKSTLWHLHGTIDSVDSIIFTTAGYEKLYEANDDYRASLTSLSSVCSSHRLIFIGCSLSDIELLENINRLHTIFDGNTGPHYALVHTSEAEKIRVKIGAAPVEVIEFSDFGQPLVDLLASISSQSMKIDGAIFPLEKPELAHPGPKFVKVALLEADPFDRPADHQELFRELTKLKCEVTLFPLNFQSLNSLEGFEYIFILSSLWKDKITVEDESLSALRVSLVEIIQNIGQAGIAGIFVFLNTLPSSGFNISELNNLRVPIIVLPKLDKSQLRSFYFQAFKKKNLDFFDSSFISGRELFKLREFGDKALPLQHNRTRLPDTIDARTVKGFVGRLSDLQYIAREIIEIRAQGEILTVKGSGGIGKTITLKKIVVEFSRRNLFRDGIEFVDCEFIGEYKGFEQNVARVFGFEVAIDLKLQIQENSQGQDLLLVLDNFETLLYINDTRPILELIDFISEYATLVVTSRELLKIAGEKSYELRSLTTDEALKLFLDTLGDRKVPEGEVKFIREKIVEELLDNNPLAIKLITKNISIGKSLRSLATELEQDIFSKVTDADVMAFDSMSDINVERKRSLYASINFSYLHLNEKEKSVFELLSLFPDGIDLEMFKRVSDGAQSDHKRDGKEKNNPTRQFLITDSLIKALENKSIIQVSNNRVRLQSLMGKFSEQKFSQRSVEEIARFQGNAFQYNNDFAEALRAYDDFQPRVCIRTFIQNQKNFLKSIAYMYSTAKPPEVCEYVINLTHLFTDICASRSLFAALDREIGFSEEMEYERLCIEIKKIVLRYYDGEFDLAFRDLQQMLPIGKIFKLPTDDRFARSCVLTSFNMYSMEGEALQAVVGDATYRASHSSYPDTLFRIGEFDNKLAMVGREEFFSFEARLVLDILDVAIIDRYIAGLYDTQRIEIMQANYVRAKLTGLPKTKLSKLVVANPYTAGLKYLIAAMGEINHEKKTKYFREAVANLGHIKYYYVEAMCTFARYLFLVNDPLFESIWGEGMELAKKYWFRYQVFQYEQIRNPTSEKFDSANYPLPQGEDWPTHIDKIKSNFVRRHAS